MDLFSILTLLGGLGLFLYGMNVMGDNLKKLAGGKLETILSKLTSNKFKGFLLGFVITAIIQSSSATTVMLVGFVNSGIMKLSQTISVILGANLGTTVTSWILSLGGISGDTLLLKLFKPTSFTPLLMIVGVVMSMSCKSDKKKDIAYILIGFAALMFGMDMMSDAMSGLKDSDAFGNILVMFSNPIMGILVGTALTAIIQSSSASVGVLQALSITGAIPYSTAIPIIFGQNIGTTITPILSSITGNTESKRVAFACLYIKIIGVTVISVFFYSLNAIFDFGFMSSNVNIFSIATIHTLFNMFDAIVLMPFAKSIEKLTVKTIKSKRIEKSSLFDALDERFLEIPSFAIEQCRELVCNMARISRESVLSAVSMLDGYDVETYQRIQDNEKLVDTYEDKLSSYFVKLSSEKMSQTDSKAVTKLLHCIGDIERISDHAEGISLLLKEMQEKNKSFSASAQKELKVISMAVNDILFLTTTAFIKDDIEGAKNVEPLEQVIDKLKLKIKDNHIARLQNGQCSIELGFVLSELLNNFARIADHCSNIAVCLIELSLDNFDTHEYLNNIKNTDIKFVEQYNLYKTKYVL